jgi:very-short-patch-repair endonuclease
MRRRPTKAEQNFKTALAKFFNTKTKKEFKQQVIQQKQFQFATNTIEKGYIGDFYLPTYKILFEVDGPNHDTPKQKRIDQIRTAALATRGIKVFRIKNELTYDPIACLEFIKTAVTQQPKPFYKPVIKGLSRQKELELQTEFLRLRGKGL